ncbi:hypothetical protein NA56DRAFT_733882 [Hyaloscypha hepaticicola]|uniref:Uncharacterized protein n=1 Tax=Hyaloscypha hepaticicola TaxID=2082293 RepID=A0A2J6PMT3_9HELO|nr:hypothetical protein NA56DRAFT_733882 [Hyaloscypha hepaticicola]
MASLPQFSGSLMSATNQNSIGLANVNVEFALIKVSPPKEFDGLAVALSQRHRENAEEGPLHRTITKLGMLFEDIIPAIPNLIEAYGKRVSEIANSPVFEDRVSGEPGPFSKHTGLDGTSIYAAATSGSKVIALHLLACMLARSWSGPEAISIWVELVHERKKFLEENSDPNQLQGLLSRAAAQQELTRAQLAAWDASARAWLQCADEVKKLQQTQLRLIIKDVGLSLETSGSTYSNVIQAWTMAISSLQKLILGIPQNISNGSVLVGLLSWHIYPDLNVVDPTANIKFYDDLVKHPGVVTLGLQRADSNGAGVHWSLALSHLRFYGDPVPVERSVGSDNSRLTIRELHMVTLGCVISTWSCPELVNITEAAECFVALGELLYGKNESEATSSIALPASLHWLELLINAANELLASSGVQLQDSLGLVEHRRRRGRKLLDGGCHDRVPMFGLANPLRFFKLSKKIQEADGNLEASILLLRDLAEQCHFDKDEWDSKSHSISDCTYSFARHSIIASDSTQFQWCPAPWAFTKSYQSWKKECHLHTGSNSIENLRECIVAGEKRWGSDLDGPYKVQAEGKSRTCKFRWIAGNLNTAALFITDHTSTLLPSHSLKMLAHLLRSASVDRSRLVKYLDSLAREGLAAIDMISDLYNEWPGATLSIDITNTAIGAAHWAPEISQLREENGQQSAPGRSNPNSQAAVFRSVKFACIAMMESGIQNLYPNSLKSVMAMSSGNSIYVAEALLQDPSQVDRSGLPEFKGIRRILGNLDRPGIVMLVPPQAPRIRKVDMSSWRVVKQTSFDGQPTDHFAQSTLHLSFTDFEVPIAIVPGARDADVVLLEAFVSVYEGRDWVADLDILGSFSSGQIRSAAGCDCLRERVSNGMGQALLEQFGDQLKSISNWEELLCCQDNLLGFEIGVVRSHNNWLSRLVAASICAQKGRSTTILPSHSVCLDCGKMVVNRMLWHERRGKKLDIVIM